MTDNVHYTKFTSSRVRQSRANKQSFDKPLDSGELDEAGKPKTITITYYTVSFDYEYPVFNPDGTPMIGPDGKQCIRIAPLMIEGCPVTCKGGVQSKKNPNGKKMDHQMSWYYDLTKPEDRAFCGRDVDTRSMLNQINRLGLFEAGGAELLAALEEGEAKMSCMERVHLAALKLVQGSAREHQSITGELNELTKLVSRPVTWKNAEDEKGAVIPGKNPIHYAKLLCSGTSKTLFTLPAADIRKSEILDWNPDPEVPSMLRGVTVSFIPVWRISNVTILTTGKASIHMELQSAVITNIEKQTIESTQAATSATLARDTSLMDNLQKQIASLKMQLLMKGASDKPKEPATDDDAPPSALKGSGSGGSAASIPVLPASIPSLPVATPTVPVAPMNKPVVAAPPPSLAAMMSGGPTLNRSTAFVTGE
jgi:hypothetical protein